MFKVILVTLTLLLAAIFHEWLADHWEALRWPALAAMLILGVIGSAKTSLPTSTERHQEFRRVLDENPWMKIYYAVYGVVVAVGFYYAISNNIDVAGEIGFFGFMGSLAVLMIPISIYKLKQLL